MKEKMMSHTWRVTGIIGGLVALVAAGIARAEIRSADLNGARTITTGDWLQLRLEVLGARLSYPAYRIVLGLSENQTIFFDFLLSRGMASTLREAGKPETEKVLTYHAEGIRDQLSLLIKDQFPELWPGFDPREDLSGRFLVPGEDWKAPPQNLAQWKEDGLYFNP